MGLRLSPEKTLITHIDEGLVFLGWRIQRHRKRGTGRSYVYIYPAKKALAAVMAKVKTVCRQNTNLPLDVLLLQLNRMLRGWTAYFKYGCSHATFSYLRSYLWKQVVGGRNASIGARHGRSCADATAYGPPRAGVACSTRPGCARSATTTGEHGSRHHGRAPHEMSISPSGLVESPVRCKAHAGFGRRHGETHQRQCWQGAPGRPHLTMWR